MRTERNACPACGASAHVAIGKPNVSAAVASLIPAAELARLQVARCAGCGMYFLDPMVYFSDVEYQALYRDTYFPEASDWWKEQTADHGPRQKLRRLSDASPGIRRFLEIGFGQGHVLRAARELGWEVYGNEVSKSYADAATAVLGNGRVSVGRLKDVNYAQESFDAIYMDSVLEHDPEPERLLREVYRILAQGGAVYLVIPNEDALFYRFRGEIWRRVTPGRSPRLKSLESPYHLVGFTPRTLRLLAKRVGLAESWLRVGSGANTIRKRPWTRAREAAQDILTFPVYLVGQLLGQGITIEAVFRKPDRGEPA